MLIRSKPRKGRVSFVHMANCRFDADRFQSAHATYAQDHLLLHAQVGIAVIERVGDVFVLLVVLRDIRVK